ncbi:MAG: hypothetical protein O7F71_06630 [Gammaproteobacteria bacterium]|nr:hypothetical protein [Gammaproteobacteria bacterium]
MPIRYWIDRKWDFRADDVHHLTTSGIRVFAAGIEASKQSQRALTVSTQLSYGLSRMYQELSD